MPKINFVFHSLLHVLTDSVLSSKEIPLRKELWTTPFPSPAHHFSSPYPLPMFLMRKHGQDFDVEIKDVATK